MMTSRKALKLTIADLLFVRILEVPWFKEV